MPLDGSEFKYEIDETTKLLIAARERIEQGWCQGVAETAHGVCAIGGLTRNAFHPYFHVIEKAMQHLARAIGLSSADDIPDWNDSRERTKADILNAYDRAIAASLSGSA